MTDDPIRDYLADLGKELGRFARHRRRTLAEVEDHLREAACALQKQGLTAEDAAREAIAQLGAPGDIVPKADRDRMRVAAATALVVLVGVGAIVGVTQPWGLGSSAAKSGNTSRMAAKTRSHPANIRTSASGPAERKMAVFSRTRTSSDIVPSSLAASMSHSLSRPVSVPASLLPGALDFSKSRLLVSSAAGSLYAVPTSSEHVCLTDSLQRGGCVDSFIHFPGTVSWGVGQPPGGGAAILDGAAPNDVTHITVNLGDGTSASATMGRNGFIYAAPTATTAINSLTITYTNGTSHTITIGYNPTTLAFSAALTGGGVGSAGATRPGKGGWLGG
jgi:hypothetical protein